MATRTATNQSDSACDVMASVDANDYVIADISEDDAWIAMGVTDAPALRMWR